MTWGQPRPWQASVVRADGPRRARFWTLDASLNTNGWRATLRSIERNAGTFMGKPGVLYNRCMLGRCVADHPPGDPSKPCQHVLEIQEPYRVSTIVDVEVTPESRVYTVHEVHDDAIWERITRGPAMFVSPSLCPHPGTVEYGSPDEWGRPVSTLNEWEALHLAFVDVPAYGPKATMVSSCQGAECGGGDDTPFPWLVAINQVDHAPGPAHVAPGETSLLHDDSHTEVVTAAARLRERALS